MLRNQFVVLAALLMAVHCSGQVVLNEVMSSNFSAYPDENGKYNDWIEVFNAGSLPENLSGYGLSDNENERFKFTFPDYMLGPQERVVVFASDENLTAIGSHWESAVRA